MTDNNIIPFVRHNKHCVSAQSQPLRAALEAVKHMNSHAYRVDNIVKALEYAVGELNKAILEPDSAVAFINYTRAIADCALILGLSLKVIKDIERDLLDKSTPMGAA